jgi:hypothetical protein
MSATYYRADEWLALLSHAATVEPALRFEMHCPNDHPVFVRHDDWHLLDRSPCRLCPEWVDLAHGRRHSSCPCDEA